MLKYTKNDPGFAVGYFGLHFHIPIALHCPPTLLIVGFDRWVDVEIWSL